MMKEIGVDLERDNQSQMVFYYSGQLALHFKRNTFTQLMNSKQFIDMSSVTLLATRSDGKVVAGMQNLVPYL